ncbi:MAG: hypothetical protein O3A00_20085 [Planctomycetota bacterium]|nr:hypothetical protein [Planctomycetota bacterium]
MDAARMLPGPKTTDAVMMAGPTERNENPAGVRDALTTDFSTALVGTTDRQQLNYAMKHDRTIYSVSVGDFARLRKPRGAS